MLENTWPNNDNVNDAENNSDDDDDDDDSGGLELYLIEYGIHSFIHSFIHSYYKCSSCFVRSYFLILLPYLMKWITFYLFEN